MKTQAFFVITLLSITSLASGKSSSQFFCGRRLANTLAMFCSYDEGVSMVKRSGRLFGYPNSVDYNNNRIPSQEAEVEANQMAPTNYLLKQIESKIGSIERDLGSKASAWDSNGVINKDEGWKWRGMLEGSRRKRGVVSECCDQPCTLDELLTYC